MGSASRAGKIRGGPTLLDKCDDCGSKTPITVLDRNSAAVGAWVCNDCVGDHEEEA